MSFPPNSRGTFHLGGDLLTRIALVGMEKRSLLFSPGGMLCVYLLYLSGEQRTMKIAIPDDYQDAVRTLDCFQKLNGQQVSHHPRAYQ